MKVLEEYWQVEVEYKNKTIHRFTTDNKEWLSSTLETIGSILETTPVNVPRKEYVIRVRAVDGSKRRSKYDKTKT
jgi:hypothetical protein